MSFQIHTEPMADELVKAASKADQKVLSSTEPAAEKARERADSAADADQTEAPSTRCPSPTESATTDDADHETSAHRKDLEEFADLLTKTLPEALEEALPCSCCVRRVLISLEDRRGKALGLDIIEDQENEEADDDQEVSELLLLWNALVEDAEQACMSGSLDMVGQLIAEVTSVLLSRAKGY